MRTVHIDGQAYALPTRYSELSPEQQILLAGALQADGSFTEVKTKLALALLDLRVLRRRPLVRQGDSFRKLDVESISPSAEVFYYLMHRSQRVHLLTCWDIQPLCSATEDLFTVSSRGLVSPNLESAAPIPLSTRLRGKGLEPYEQGLCDLRFIDFIDAETYLSQHYQGEQGALYRFIVRLYRRADRDTLTEASLEELGRLLQRRISPAVAEAIRLNYEGQKAFLYGKFGRIFSSSSTTSGEQVDASVVFDTYCQLVATISGGDPTKHRQIKQELLYEALYALDERMRQHEINQMYHGARPTL